MQVVLLERVEKLGQMGAVVSVRPGFARNFLLPQGKALRATKENLVRFEKERVQLEARNLELRKEAEEVAATLNGQIFVIIRQAGDSGALYGSVSGRDVAEAATDGGFSVSRGQVVLDKPIKELGIHPIRVVLHPEVSASISVNVARSADEAEIQASGKSISQLRAEEEAAEAAEAAANFEGGREFDVDSLFEDDAPRGEDDEA